MPPRAIRHPAVTDRISHTWSSDTRVAPASPTGNPDMHDRLLRHRTAAPRRVGPRGIATVAALLAFALTACGDTTPAAADTPPPDDAPAEAAMPNAPTDAGIHGTWRVLPSSPGSNDATTERAGRDGAATTPTARHENAFVALDGRLYLLGGRGDRPLEIFDPATGTWTRGATPPLELHHVQAIAHDGRLWLLGALTGAFPAEPPVPAVWIYDPAADAWAEGASIPEHRRRGASGVAVHDGVFYLVGGLTGGHNGGYVAWLDAFDPASGQWRELADAPRPRDHFHAAVLDGRLYAAGGRTSSHATGEGMSLTVTAVDVYDIAAGTWSTLDDPLPTARSGNATVAYDGRIFVLGGESEAQTPAHDEVEAWNPALARWEHLPSLPTGRHGTQATLHADALHIAAGSGDRGGGPELDDHLVFATEDVP